MLAFLLVAVGPILLLTGFGAVSDNLAFAAAKEPGAIHWFWKKTISTARVILNHLILMNWFHAVSMYLFGLHLAAQSLATRQNDNIQATVFDVPVVNAIKFFAFCLVTEGARFLLHLIHKPSLGPVRSNQT